MMHIFATNFGFFRRVRLCILLSLSVALACSDQEDRETKNKKDAGDDAGDASRDLRDGGDDVEDPSELLFDPLHLVEVDIEMSAGDWDLIRNEGKRLVETMAGCGSDFEYTWVSATATIDGVTLKNVAVRKKGHLGSLSTVRPSLKVDFNRTIKEQSAWGMTRMTLNNDRQDVSHTHQCMSYQLFRDAGGIAPRCNFARVRVNGKDLGVYSHVETIRKPFLARHFEDASGNLFESGGNADFHDDLALNFEIKNNETTSDRSDLYRVVEAMQVDDADLYESLDEVIDMDAFLTFWAMEVITGHWDSFSGDQNNFFAYHDPKTDKFYFIPWGTDGAFAPDHIFLPPDIPTSVYAWSWPTFRLYSDLDSRAKYHDRLRELLDKVWDEDKLLEEVDRIGELTSADEVSLEKQRDFIRGRKERILDELVGDGPDWAYRPKTGLPEEVCLPTSEISGRFEAVWGKVDAYVQSPESYFELDPGDVPEQLAFLDMHTEEITQPFNAILAAAGFEENGLSIQDGTPVIRLIGVTPASPPYTVLLLLFEPSLFGQSEWTFHGFETFGVIVRSTAGPADSVTLGYIGDGEVVFEEVGTNDGDPVNGTFSGVFVPMVFDQFNQRVEPSEPGD
ncbi:MAG: CotH kinase family protein [Deltaproteobacteria bacterium]|nr:CotH kinase family protein [Deltaproteobacteria bacterium]